MQTIRERTGNQEEFYKTLLDNFTANIRVAIPAIIQSFDAATQTVTAQPSIRERTRDKEGNLKFLELPLLLDVPLVLPKSGNFILTMPVQAGDECLIIFADMCIDSWWQSGEVQNWNDKRRHDLSDAFAILGTWSQPNKIDNFSTASTRLRTLNGLTYVEVTNTDINLKNQSGEVNLKESGEIKAFNDNGSVDLSSSGNITLENSNGSITISSTGAISIGNNNGSIGIDATGNLTINGNSLSESYINSASIVRNTGSTPQSAVFQ